MENEAIMIISDEGSIDFHSGDLRIWYSSTYGEIVLGDETRGVALSDISEIICTKRVHTMLDHIITPQHEITLRYFPNLT